MGSKIITPPMTKTCFEKTENAGVMEGRGTKRLPEKRFTLDFDVVSVMGTSPFKV